MCVRHVFLAMLATRSSKTRFRRRVFLDVGDSLRAPISLFFSRTCYRDCILTMLATLSSEACFCLIIPSDFSDPLERHELMPRSLRIPLPLSSSRMCV